MKIVLHVISDDSHLNEHLSELFKSVGVSIELHENTTQFCESHTDNRVGCILFDVNHSQIQVIEFLLTLKQRNSVLPVIIISDIDDIQTAIEAMKLGVKNFLLKPFNEQLLLETIQHHLRDAEAQSSKMHCKMDSLTAREKQILDLILEGEMNKDIANELVLSISTVEAHRRNIMKKLGVSSKAQLIKTCLEADIVNLSKAEL